jgi:hypothetical protein
VTDVGKLTQPLVRLKWGDLDLTEYSAGGMRPQPIFYEVRLNLQKTDAAPTLEFNISPSPPAFQAFVECKEKRIDQPIVLDIGYANGTIFSLKFFYAGCSFSTGHEQDITVQAVSVIKGAWTNNRVNFTMDKPVALKDFPGVVKSKCGEPCSKINFKFAGRAADDAKEIQIKHAAINQSPHKIIVDIARANGMLTSINPAGDLVIHYPYNMPKENAKDKAKVKKTNPGYDDLLRNVFIAGPGLLNSFKREQRFNVGQTTFDFAAAFTSPVAFEQDNSKIVNTKTESGRTTSAQQKTPATVGQSNPTVAQSGVTKTAASLKEARAAWAKGSTTTGQGSFFMVPYLVGIKPRDILVIPSLNPDDPYFEDWIVDSVNYDQKNEGGVEIGVTCSRPFPGEGFLVDEQTKESIFSVLREMRTTKDWHNMYWGVETQVATTQQAGTTPAQLPNPAAAAPV